MNIAILGCSGSIGTTTLNIIRKYSNDFNVVLLANDKNQDALKKLGKEFKNANLYSSSGFLKIDGNEVAFNPEYLFDSNSYANVDIVVNGISGIAGLKPSIACIKAKKILVTANKESSVCGGNLLQKYIDEYKAEIRPIDSEHSTIWQCLESPENVERIILTASGGAFRDLDKESLSKAKAKDALKHPTWNMGKKVTIDCATLMNKGMEIIEAQRLFGIKEVAVLMHRESIIHSLVEMKDGMLIAGLSTPDMTIPIQYALSFPNRKETQVKKLDLEAIQSLNFGKINEELFPCLAICKKVSQYGDKAGTIMNAANEICVNEYLADAIGFYDIPRVITRCLDKFGLEGNFESLDELFKLDNEVREYAFALIKEGN